MIGVYESIIAQMKIKCGEELPQKQYVFPQSTGPISRCRILPISTLSSMSKKQPDIEETNEIYLPPVTNYHTQEEVKIIRPPSFYIERRYEKTERLSQLFQKAFGTKTSSEIVSIIKYLRDLNKSLTTELKYLVDQIVFLEEKSVELRKPLPDLRSMQTKLFNARSELVSQANDLSNFQTMSKQVHQLVNKIGNKIAISSSLPFGLQRSVELINSLNDYFAHPLHLNKIRKTGSLTKGNFSVVNSTSFRGTFSSILQSSDSFHSASSKFEPIHIGNILEEGGSESPSDVPQISISSLGGQRDYFPSTRSTRRAFSSASSSNDETPEIDFDFEQVGRTIGRSYVDRYCPLIMSLSNDVEIDKGPTYIPDDEVINFEPTNALDELFNYYTTFSDYLYLSVFSEKDLIKLDETFLKFINVRDSGLEVAAEAFELSRFISKFTNIQKENVCIACWIARDFIRRTRLSKHVPMILTRLSPFYKELQSTISTNMELEACRKFICWFALFNQCWGISEGINKTISGLVNESLDHLMTIFSNSPHSKMAKAGQLALFKLASKIPNILPSHVIMRSALSTVQKFIHSNRALVSCVEAATSFFIAVRPTLDKESVMCHTNYFYHLLIEETLRCQIRPDVIQCYIAVLTSIVESRSSYTNDQLLKLNFLYFLIKNIELEAMISTNAEKEAQDNAEQTDEKPVGKVCYLNLNQMQIQIPSLNLENPKLQLHFRPGNALRGSGIKKITVTDYLELRRKYSIYASSVYHAHFFLLFFATIIDHSLHRLDVTFCDPFPSVNRKPNVLYTIIKHLENQANQDVTPFLTKLLDKREDSLRLLRLIIPGMFDPKKYTSGQHIASGAFGAVMAVKEDATPYAVKVLEKSRSEFENPHLVEVFTEVSLLDLGRGDRRITQLHDYGCTPDSYYIVMEYYPLTLKSWRRSYLKKDQTPPLDLLLAVFKAFLKSCTFLTDKKVNHFDIKCDNVMLDLTGHPCLADFGEAMAYTNENNCFSMLNKGTEWVKSPEMLSIAINSTVTNPKFDRLRKIGAGPASDVWSIGCLFYELIVGEFMFVDTDWSRFFLRITEKGDILTEENRKALPDSRCAQFIEFVLQRPVRTRPNLSQVITKFDEIFPEASKADLPKVQMPKWLLLP